MNTPPDIVGVLLAAGRGTRFSPDASLNKLLADAGGEPVCAAAARTLLLTLPRVVAATSPHSPVVAQVLRDAGCGIVVCDRSAQGMGHTIAQAVGELRAERQARGEPLPAWCVMPGDMPRIAPSTIGKLVTAWRELDEAKRQLAAFAPAYAGKRGHPVLLGPGWTDTLCSLTGDAGARRQIAPYLRLIEVDDSGCLLDVDTPQALAGLAPRRS